MLFVTKHGSLDELAHVLSGIAHASNGGHKWKFKNGVLILKSNTGKIFKYDLKALSCMDRTSDKQFVNFQYRILTELAGLTDEEFWSRHWFRQPKRKLKFKKAKVK